ncbi:MAG: late competence development ComFB family protein [Treponema sp.]|jgi:competence protein ComFB|nr:late competence development ComFB family protein [Treponema sp.]
MAFIDEYDFDLLKNEAEVLVIREMEYQLKSESEDMCRCNECIVDIAAIALNGVKPLYRFSLLGTLYASQAMTERAYANSVKQAVAQAIKKVKKNPAHD